jgi:predicted metal-binding membrane protein
VIRAPAYERLLKRDRLITLAGLVLLCGLAWIYIATGAGLGMSAWDMTSLALFPHRQEAAAAMPGMDMGAFAPPAWTTSRWALMIAMWWIMMIAMMAPSAAPVLLLYGQVCRHAFGQGRASEGLAPTGAFAAGYGLAWLAFSVVAAGLSFLLERGGALSAMMASRAVWLSSATLIATGLYQLSPLKNRCLRHCRSPAYFLTRHWRPGALGALRLGAWHGCYCVGCCWMLMALLFVGGVMNLVWIALLALFVLIEKLLPFGRGFGIGAGLLLIGWGVATLLV